MEKIILSGNVGKEPEMKYVIVKRNGEETSQAVTNFSLATSHMMGTKTETHWFRVTVWGKLAELCSSYIKSGNKIQLVGRLQADEKGNPRTFQRADGTTGASFEIVADEVEFAPKSMSAQTDEAAPASDDVEIPF